MFGEELLPLKMLPLKKLGVRYFGPGWFGSDFFLIYDFIEIIIQNYWFFSSLCRNQEVSDKTTDPIAAVVKSEMSNPGTTKLVTQRRKTLIKNAATPKVRMVIGRATICKTGFRNVLKTPKTTAVTTKELVFSNVNPGTR